MAGRIGVWISSSVLLLTACARVPATATDASSSATAPSSSEINQPEPPRKGPSVLGDTDERATALAGLAGIWAYEGEVWQIKAERAQAYRPRDHDIQIERRIEMIAPCMFVVHEGEALLGPYVVDHRGPTWTRWTRGGVAAFRLSQRDESAVCRGEQVYLFEDDRCEAWRFDLGSRSFESGPSCRLVVAASAPEHESPERSIDLVGPVGQLLETIVVGGWGITDGPTGSARSVPNLASGCANFDPDSFGCTVAQAQLLRDDYWASEDGHCSGSNLRIDLEVLFASKSVYGPRGCSIEPLPGEPLFAAEPGVVAIHTQAVVQPGAAISLEFVFENTATQPRFVRLPTQAWDFRATRAGKPIELGGCHRYSILGIGPPTSAAEFRLEPGGRLTLVAPWIAIGPVKRGEQCRVAPLPAKRHELSLTLVEDQPGAALTASVSVEGKKTCDPCPDPWDSVIKF